MYYDLFYNEPKTVKYLSTEGVKHERDLQEKTQLSRQKRKYIYAKKGRLSCKDKIVQAV